MNPDDGAVELPALEVIRTDQPAITAAGEIARRLTEAVAVRGRASVALSGGSSAPPMLDALAAADLDWTRVDVLQVDERVAPDGHEDRNAGPLLERLVGPAGIPRDAVHLMPVGDRDVPTAVRDHVHELHRLLGPRPVIDVVHLGLGADGHTASLVPDAVALQAVADVAAVDTYQGRQRITLTAPLINRARHRVWLVPVGPGDRSGKSAALRALLAGTSTAPAGLILREGSTVVTDLPAED